MAGALDGPQPFDHIELERCQEYLDQDLARPDAGWLIARFYDPAGNYAGRTFLDMAPNPPHAVSVADLLAVTLLQVRVSDHAVRQLLEPTRDQTTVLAALRRVPVSANLGDADEQVLSAAWQLRRSVMHVIGEHAWVTASKLCARKRPALVPIVDRVVRRRLPISDGRVWRTIQALMTDTRCDRLRELANEASGMHGSPDLSDVPALRLFDTLVWMANSKSAEPTRAKYLMT
jgi:hypothetical protein